MLQNEAANAQQHR